MRTVAVIQARTGSSRLPGKVLLPVRGRPLVAWTLAAVQAIPGLSAVVVATTTDPADDELAATAAALGASVHRGPVFDVLTRCWEAVAPFDPQVVVRQTADNPFADPEVAAAQVDALVGGGADYVGIAGWPLGIAAEACRASALATAAREATESAEREHVMPFIYRRPERFTVAALPPPAKRPAGWSRWRFTVDVAADLAFVRAIADRLGHEPPIRLGEIESLLAAEPKLLELNRAVEQKSWQVVDERAGAAASGATDRARGRTGEPWTS